MTNTSDRESPFAHSAADGLLAAALGGQVDAPVVLALELAGCVGMMGDQLCGRTTVLDTVLPQCSSTASSSPRVGYKKEMHAAVAWKVQALEAAT